MAVIFVVALILIGTSATLYALKLWPFIAKSEAESTKIDLSEASEETKDAGASTKEQSTKQDGKPGQNSDRAVAPEVPAGSKAESGLKITSASQIDREVRIRVLIPVLTGQGTCELKMTGPNDLSYSASAPVQAQSSSSTCAGFNVPSSELSSGDWSISVTLDNEDLIGSDTNKVVVR